MEGQGQPPHTTSSMPSAAAVTEAHDFLSGAAYLTGDRRPTPGPPEHAYTGAYGVSQGADHGLHQSNTPYYLNVGPMDGVEGMICRTDNPMQMDPDRTLSRQQVSGASLLNHQPQGVNERIPANTMMPNSSQEASASTNGARRRATSSRVRKTKSGGRKSQSVTSPLGNDHSISTEEHKNCLGIEEPPRLKVTCPAEEREIFESRWRHRHKKGHDMWESIQADFENKFGKHPGKESLQMKFKRGRSKFYEWLPEDVSHKTRSRCFGSNIRS